MGSFLYRLTDVNPVTGREFRDSLWMELPGPLADMLSDLEGWGPAGWDAAVRARREGVACEPPPCVFEFPFGGSFETVWGPSGVAGERVGVA